MKLLNLISTLTISVAAQNQCSPQTIEQTNAKLLPYLNKLVQTSVYRYFKANLQKECPFWQENLLCSLKDCTVIPADEQEVPDEWQKESLSQVDYTPSNSFKLVKKCVTNDKDFCLMEDETDQDGEFINLLKNPERYSGYAGPSAARVWSAIYNENCFSPKPMIGNEICHEKQVFYKIISGLHTSISMHICGDWLDRNTGHWIRNVTCYEQRIGQFPERIDNLYFYWSVMVRAISKLSPYLENHPYCDGIEDATQIKGYVGRVVEQVNLCPTTFDEREFFAPQNRPLINDFKHKFRNISSIMDCVGCEKCRLWGKIQTYGLGTALKILFSYKTEPELVSLMNAFHRVSESVNFNQEFKDMIGQKKLVQKMDAEMLLDLEVWFNGMNSRAFTSISFWIGSLILLFGILRLFQKSGEMERKYEESRLKVD